MAFCCTGRFAEKAWILGAAARGDSWRGRQLGMEGPQGRGLSVTGVSLLRARQRHEAAASSPSPAPARPPEAASPIAPPPTFTGAHCPETVLIAAPSHLLPPWARVPLLIVLTESPPLPPFLRHHLWHPVPISGMNSGHRDGSSISGNSIFSGRMFMVRTDVEFSIKKILTCLTALERLLPELAMPTRQRHCPC